MLLPCQFYGDWQGFFYALRTRAVGFGAYVSKPVQGRCSCNCPGGTIKSHLGFFMRIGLASHRMLPI